MPGTDVSSPALHFTPPGLAQLQSRRARQHHVGHHADPDHDHVAVELEPALGHDPAHPAVGALEALQLVAAVHLHPVLLEHVLEEAPDLAAELALERHVLLHHDRALDPVGGRQRRGHLAADVAPADQHGALGALGVGADRVRVAERAQVVDSLEVARRRRARGARSRRSRSARSRTPPRPWSTASPPARRCRASSRWCASSARCPARPTTRRGGTARPRASPCPAGSPSTAAAGCRAGRTRARPAAPSPRRPPRAASARSWRRRARRRSAGGRPCGGPP